MEPTNIPAGDRIPSPDPSTTNTETRVAKTLVTLTVKPWDDKTDMEKLEAGVRAIEKEGLVWGTSTLVEVGYGVRMLQINVVVEDRVSVEDLAEEIVENLEEYVQSCDTLAMQKL